MQVDAILHNGLRVDAHQCRHLALGELRLHVVGHPKRLAIYQRYQRRAYSTAVPTNIQKTLQMTIAYT